MRFGALSYLYLIWLVPALAAVYLYGFSRKHKALATFMDLGAGFGTSLIFVGFCYSGWNAAAYVAAEMLHEARQTDCPCRTQVQGWTRSVDLAANSPAAPTAFAGPAPAVKKPRQTRPSSSSRRTLAMSSAAPIPSRTTWSTPGISGIAPRSICLRVGMRR